MKPENPNLRQFFFSKSEIFKLGMPKKMTPKSQGKIKPEFPQYPFLTIF